MKNWKAIVGVLAVFVLGIIAGGLVTAKVAQRRFHRALAAGPDAVAELMVRRLTWRLRLDAAQQDQVRAIVRDAQREMQPVRRQAHEIVQEADSKVRTVLRPDQLDRFDKLVAERRARWADPKP